MSASLGGLYIKVGSGTERADETPPAAICDAVGYLLIRSTERGALARIQTKPLFDGLKELEITSATRIFKPGESVEMPRASHAVVHYNDYHAIMRAKQLKESSGTKIICMTSDIGDLDHHIWISGIADLIVAPTKLHCEILQSALSVPVIVIPEGIDEIALPQGGQSLLIGNSERMCWFGYPESFNKGLKYMMPHALEVSEFRRENFSLISQQGVSLLDGYEHIPFSEQTFYRVTSGFSYALLSHFAYDLHINSYIKTPNKLITSLVRGMIPVASNTPNYRSLMEEYGLGRFLFSTRRDLTRILNDIALNKVDFESYNIDVIAQDLIRKFGPVSLARTFVERIAHAF